LRQDQEEALARAQRAWKTADHDYFEEHRLEKRLLPISLDVFLFGLGTVFLSSALAANSSAIPRAISIAAVTLQIVAALTFIIIQLRKRGRVWSEIQQAWASNGEQEKTG
jgi:protein-S-isoprenylcysteine O-methyltransferase Ste14